jgi:hypothetical protein
MTARPTGVTTPDGHRRELMRLLRENTGRFDLWTIWRDFVEMAAIAISNAVDLRQRDVREAQYMAIVKKYTRDEANRFAHALGALTNALEAAEFADVLGATFMELELGSKWAGQFFTPYEVCRLMAAVSLGDPAPLIADRGFITVSDPAVGAGALPIAMAQAVREAGHNYQRCMHVTAQDVDARAAHMAYIQLSLLHVPAVVIVGNTLAGECREQWFTPAHVLGGWGRRLASQRLPSDQAPVRVAPPVPPVAPTQPKEKRGQPDLLGLFD